MSLNSRQSSQTRALECLQDGARRGLLRNIAEDSKLDGRTITLEGKPLVNFGSCSYLGLETHPKLVTAVCDAVVRFGTQFSSSRAYVSAPGYGVAEELYSKIFASRPALMCPTTTLGHIAMIPTIIGENDALVLDRQVHNSVQTAAQLVRSRVQTFRVLGHNDIDALGQFLSESYATHDRVWYAVDGLYSMHADFAPFDRINDLMAMYDNLWLYVDDAHAVSWMGTSGSGSALDHIHRSNHPRLVVAASLVKSFAAGGAILSFPTMEMRDEVFTVGGPMIFSGPVQPPMLGAAIASAELHLSDSILPRRGHLLGLIDHFNARSTSLQLPLVCDSRAPIRCIEVGSTEQTFILNRELRSRGFYVNSAVYPAVPIDRGGIRITLTAHHTDDDVDRLVEAVASTLPVVAAR
ncbi:aminotransferase class I/II-fold pyridoxal phosphate-dependent enzyme [Nocardia asteroides]|uniref:aminotransferase class I/II-fold pyridoxal phosphate-dependent enzyme n=1 Tax=Nocardia asteroides TaxID=1824 RepID=UPI0037C7D7C8